MKKKLLMVLSHCSTGGMPQVAVKRIELLKDEYEIYVIEYSNISDHFVVQKNKIKKLIPEDKFFTLDDNKLEILFLIEKIKPDFIHFEEIPEMFMDYKITYQIYKKNRNYKIFETTHSSDFDVDNKMFFPDKFIFVSQYNSFKFNKFGVPIDVVEYPVDKKIISENEKYKLMSKFGLDPNYKHVLNVGLFTPRKNQAYAFEIAKKLLDKKIKFHFIGNQAINFKNYWEPLMKDKPDNCVVWGERSDVEDFYKACDLFLFTSMGFKYDKELNPLVIKEALQENIPLFLFPLDVYCGKYDDNEMVTYLTGYIDKDVQLISNFLKIESKYKKLEDKINFVQIFDDNTNLLNLKYKNINYNIFEYKNYDNKITYNNCLRPDDINRIGIYGLGLDDYNEYINYRLIIEKYFNLDEHLIILNKNYNIKDKELFFSELGDKIDYINKNNIDILSLGGFMDSHGSNEIDKIENINWACIVDKIDNCDLIILNKNSRNKLLSKISENKWDNKNFWFTYLSNKLSMTYNSYIEKQKIFKEPTNIDIKYNKNENKIIFKYNIEKEEKFNIKFIDKSNIIYETSYIITNKFETWSTMPKLLELEYIDIDLESKNNNYRKRLYLKKEIEKIPEIEIVKSIEDTDKIFTDKDSIFVLSSYPNTSIKNDITLKSIESVKKSNKEIILSSHIPVNVELQEKCNYFIYDKYNPLLKHTLYNNYWFENDDFRSDIKFENLSKKFNLNQSLTVLNNIDNSIKLAKSLGYKRIINITYDYIFSEQDIKTINNICERLDKDSKKGYFMEFKDNGLNTYKTVFFIIDIDLYLEVFNNPRTPENFNLECEKLECDNFLERYFYKKLNNRKDDLIIESKTEEELFNGDINLFSGVEYLTILPIKNVTDKFILWFSSNNKIDKRKIIFEIFNNNEKINEFVHIIENKTFFWKEIDLKENDNIEIKIKYLDNENDFVIDTEYFGVINKQNFDEKLKDRGLFTIKNNVEVFDIDTIINLNPKDYHKLINVINSVKEISKNIIVCYNNKDNQINYIENEYKLIDKLNKEGIDIIEYDYDYDVNYEQNYWDNISRLIGMNKSKSNWILFMNSNEILKDFNKISIKQGVDAYLFDNVDSPLLIKNKDIKINGDRLDIMKKTLNNFEILDKKYYKKSD